MLFVIRLFGSLIFQNGNRRLNWSGMGERNVGCAYRSSSSSSTTKLWIRFNDFNGCSMWNRSFLRTDAKRHDLFFFHSYFFFYVNKARRSIELWAGWRLALSRVYSCEASRAEDRRRRWGWCFSAHPQPIPLIQSRWQFYSIHAEL